MTEPLLHFVLLGAVLWGLVDYRQSHGQQHRITISRARVEQLAEHYRQQYGALPTARQLDSLVDAAITEEITYRAALEQGLDKDDEIVRRRLIQKYDFLQQDLSDPREPTDAELRSFFAAHRDPYRLPERVTFTHVYFSPDRLGEEGARAAAQTLASTLNRQGVTRAADQGDRFPGPRDIVALSPQELDHVFGQDGLSREVFGIETGRWSAPLHSGFGWHTVYVSSREPGGEANFASIRERVREDYLEAERTRRNAEASAALRRRFEIVRE